MKWFGQQRLFVLLDEVFFKFNVLEMWSTIETRLGEFGASLKVRSRLKMGLGGKRIGRRRRSGRSGSWVGFEPISPIINLSRVGCLGVKEIELK